MDVEITSSRDWDFSDPAFSDYESDDWAALKAFMVQEILAIWPSNIPKPYAIEIDFVIDEDRELEFIYLNRYRRKRPKVDASILDSALSHPRRSDASEKKRRK